jgi:hypothetical protein
MELVEQVAVEVTLTELRTRVVVLVGDTQLQQLQDTVAVQDLWLLDI